MKFKEYLYELTIQKTAAALAKKGYKLGDSKHDKKWNIEYNILTPDGKSVWMGIKEILKIIGKKRS